MSIDLNVLEWRPHKRQEEFLQLPDDIFEALYGGAAMGGKTELLYMIPIVRGWFKYPRYKGIILRRTFPELENEVILRATPIYEKTGAKYDASKKRFMWPSGAVQRFGHAEHEKDITKYDGDQYNYVAFDELTHFTEYQYTYLFTRCRSADPRLPQIIRAATNPGNIGHAWVRKRFVEPYPNGGRVIKDKQTGLLRFFVPAKVFDNTYAVNKDQYVKQLESLPSEADVKAKLHGDWWVFKGQVFQVRRKPMSDEPENAVHVIQPFEIPKYWPRFLAGDPGYAAGGWMGWAALSPEKRVYVYRELSFKERLVSDWGTEVGRLCKGEHIVGEALDGGAWADDGVERVIDQYMKASGRNPEKADKARISGKLLIQEWLRWWEKKKLNEGRAGFDRDTGDKILRLYGWNEFQKYVKSFEPEEDEGPLPKLQIFDESPDFPGLGCPTLIETLGQCVYNNPGKGDIEDVAEFNGDDPYDGFRYLCKLVAAHMDYNDQSVEHMNKVALAEKVLQETMDVTAFYRRMESIEQKMKQTAHSNTIRRHGRRRVH